MAARKPGLAFTLGAMGSRQHNFYNDAFRRAGYEDAAREVQRLWLDGQARRGGARVPDEMALKANLLGTEAMVRERLRVYRAAASPRCAWSRRRRDARRAAGHARPADGAGPRPARVTALPLPFRERVGVRVEGASSRADFSSADTP